MLVGYSVYMNWTLGSRTESLVPGDDGADDFPMSAGATDHSNQSEPSEAGEDPQPEWEPPSFSREGLLQWLYQRCTGDPMLNFQTAVLLGWTALCCFYTWWVLRSSPWQTATAGPRPIPATVLIPETPEARELPELRAEAAEGNIGISLKHEQWKRWLVSSIAHLPGSPEESAWMIETLRDEHPLSDDDESPLHHMLEDAKDFLVQASGEIYVHVMSLLEKTTVENAVDLLRFFADAHRTPDGPPGGDNGDDDDDDDESMGPAETESEKRARYCRDPMEQCSDPELWAVLNYGPGDSDEAQEF
eukprot:s56_g35.t1